MKTGGKGLEEEEEEEDWVKSHAVSPGEAAVGIDMELEPVEYLGPGRGVGGSIDRAFHQPAIGGSGGCGPATPDVAGHGHGTVGRSDG